MKGSLLIAGIVVVIIVVAGALIFTAAPKATGEPIKIGFIGPLTGDAAYLGQNSKLAAEIAVKEINSAGGINGRPLEIIYEDSKCNAKDGATAGNKLINIDKVPVIIGGACSSETLAVAPIAEQAKTVVLSYCASAPKVSQAGDYIFRDYPSDSFQGDFLAQYVYNSGIRKAAILYCLSDYCIGLHDIFKQKFEGLGGTIVADEGFEQSSRDLRSQLTKIKESGAEAVYFASYTEATISGLIQAKELGLNAKMFGADAWDDTTIWTNAKEAGEGAKFTTIAPATPEFHEKFVKETGRNDTICAPQAYDAVHIIANVMKKVGTNSELIKNELYNVKDYKGASGTITFDENGDPTEANYIIKVVKNNIPVDESQLQKQTVKIGAILPLTGSSALLGESARDAMLLAKEQLANKKYNYEIIFEDDQLNAQLTAKAVNKLVFADKVDVILSFSSGSGNVVSPVTEQNKVIHIGVASDPNVAKGTYNFIHATPPEEEAKAWVAEAQKRGVKRIAIFSMNQQGALAITNAVKKQVIGKDLQIVSDDVFDLGTRDFRTIILKAKEKNPDIYLLHTFSPELELLTKQIKELGIATPLTSIEAFEFTEDPSLFEGYWYVQAADPTNSYISMYKAKYGKDPQAFSANTYDNVLLVAEGFEKAGDGKTIPSHDKVAVEMLNIKDFSGALGLLNMGTDHIVHSKAVVRTIKDGKPVTISTQAGTIKLGATLPLSGDVANLGISAQNAIKLAVEEINKKGGVNVQLIYEDDQCDGKKSVITVSKLISVDNVAAIIGPLCSTALLPAAPIAESGKTILFSGSATNAKITTAGDYIFRNIPSDSLQGKFAAEFAYNNLNARKAAIEYANEEYSVGLKDEFSKRFTELGGQIVLTQAHDRGATDLRTQITKIKGANPELVYLAAFPADIGNFMKQTKELGMNAKTLSSETADDPQVIQIAQEAVNGLMFTRPKELTSQQYKDAYNAKYNSEPLLFSEFYYDIAYLLADAAKTCGSDSTCIKNELYKVKDYQGASGVITIDSNGDLASAQFIVKTYANQTAVEYRG